MGWWLGFSTVTTGARVQSLDREMRSCKPCGTAKKKKIIIMSKRGSWIAQLVKNLAAMQETPVHSLGQEDPLEKA